MGRHKQFVPEDVVDCVMDVFWNNGYAATSPRALADAAGIGVSSLYNAFGSKHDLFLRALRRYAANQLAHQIPPPDQPRPAPARTRRPPAAGPRRGGPPPRRPGPRHTRADTPGLA